MAAPRKKTPAEAPAQAQKTVNDETGEAAKAALAAQAGGDASPSVNDETGAAAQDAVEEEAAGDGDGGADDPQEEAVEKRHLTASEKDRIRFLKGQLRQTIERHNAAAAAFSLDDKDKMAFSKAGSDACKVLERAIKAEIAAFERG